MCLLYWSFQDSFIDLLTYIDQFDIFTFCETKSNAQVLDTLQFIDRVATIAANLARFG